MRRTVVLAWLLSVIAAVAVGQGDDPWVTVDGEYGRVTCRARYRHFAESLVEGWGDQRARVADAIGFLVPIGWRTTLSC